MWYNQTDSLITGNPTLRTDTIWGQRYRKEQARVTTGSWWQQREKTLWQFVNKPFNRSICCTVNPNKVAELYIWILHYTRMLTAIKFNYWLNQLIQLDCINIMLTRIIYLILTFTAHQNCNITETPIITEH